MEEGDGGVSVVVVVGVDIVETWLKGGDQQR